MGFSTYWGVKYMVMIAQMPRKKQWTITLTRLFYFPQTWRYCSSFCSALHFSFKFESMTAYFSWYPKVKVSEWLSHVRPFETPWTVAGQAPLSMEFSRILKWVAIPFSRGSSQPRDRTQVSCISGRFFTTWATREALKIF